jgi:serine O-acetyltransferase
MLQKIKALPHILLFRRSSARPLIEKDMSRWVQIYMPERAGRPASDNLAWVLATYPEFRNLFYYRLGRYSRSFGRLMSALAKALHKPMETLGFGLPEIGPGLFIRHGFTTAIGAEKVGENCWVNPGVTIGYKNEEGVPTIGNNVYIGAGAKILGPLTIGDNVFIGANAVVTKSVPSNCTVVGIPARIIKRDGQRVN